MQPDTEQFDFPWDIPTKEIPTPFPKQPLTQRQKLVQQYLHLATKYLTKTQWRKFHPRVARLVWKTLKNGETTIPPKYIQNHIQAWERQEANNKAQENLF